MMAPCSSPEVGAPRIYALLVVGAIVAILAIFAVWTARQLLQKDNWDQTTQAMIADDGDPHARSPRTSSTRSTTTRTRREAAGRAAPRLQALAAPAAGALREPAVRAVDKLLDSPRLQALWTKAATLTHDQFIASSRTRAGRSRENGERGRARRAADPRAGGHQLGLPINGSRLPEGAA